MPALWILKESLSQSEPKKECHSSAYAACQSESVLPMIIGASVIPSLNSPQREWLPRFKSGISVVKKVKLTVVTAASERLSFSES
jgi:hypothetical protein